MKSDVCAQFTRGVALSEDMYCISTLEQLRRDVKPVSKSERELNVRYYQARQEVE